MKQAIKLIPVGVLLFCLANVYAQDWPQYLGPERNSISPQKNILRSWPENGPEILWAVKVGLGNGGPIVKDGKVYFLDRDDQVGDNMRCFDLNGGEELWNFAYDAPGSVRFPGSRSVPVIDGNHVYSCGHNGDLYCIDINTHEPVWNRNVWTDFGGGSLPRWAIAQCPLVYGDLLILASQAPEAGVVAYDKLTGHVKWATDSLGRVGYVSPSLVNVGEKDQVVMITAAAGGRGQPRTGGKVVGIDPQSGNILWVYTNWQCGIPAPSAVDAGDGKVLVTGGYGAGAAMLKVEKKADGSYVVSELFKNADFGAHTKPPILFKNHFYIQFSTNSRRDGLVCMSMDGQIMWKTGREPVFNKGSMILADGLIFATDGNQTLYLIEPDPTAFKPIASANVLELVTDLVEPRYGSQNWAPIALADGKLLIRDQTKMVCVKVAE